MAIENLFNSASSIMTAVSFTAFLGILWWVFVHKRSADFDEVARLPFADEEDVKAGAASSPAARSAAHSPARSDAHATTGSAQPTAHATEVRHG
jgi:cytochrome c oxidase cbb3-type subunit 4